MSCHLYVLSLKYFTQNWLGAYNGLEFHLKFLIAQFLDLFGPYCRFVYKDVFSARHMPTLHRTPIGIAFFAFGYYKSCFFLIKNAPSRHRCTHFCICNHFPCAVLKTASRLHLHASALAFHQRLIYKTRLDHPLLLSFPPADALSITHAQHPGLSGWVFC